MKIKNLKIKNFRNYDSLNVNFNSKLNIICGNNGEGKTNLLESIYLLALTKSHRTYLDGNLIKNGEEFANVQGNFEINHILTKHEITISKNKKILKKDFNVISKVTDYISYINIIIFYPDDLEIIKGSPVERRNYLNLEISQLYSTYLDVLNKYNKILKMRNNYLKNNIKIDQNYYDILTDHLIKYSLIISKLRLKYLNKINQKCGKIYQELTNLEGFNIKYVSSTDNIDDSELLKEKFKKAQINEIKYKQTLFGPHKDDFEFYLGEKNLKNYGSQGQQRLAILALKLAELEIMTEVKGETPILLLDDVFSELDITKRNKLLNYISKNCQVIITTTDLKNIDENILKKSKKIFIENGKATKGE